jgi:hypothetical protein
MTTTVQTQSSARDKMLQRVINLRARAEDEASSEAEMNTAFTMAMKLMDSYNIEEAELAIAESEGRIELEIVQKVADTSLLKGKSHKHRVLSTLMGIATFTETKVVVSTYSGNITFTGHRPDTELANYMVALVREALDREFENYKRGVAGRIGYGAKNSFQIAMAARISSRLYDMDRERTEEREENRETAERLKIENADTSSSTALVISEIAEQKAKEVEMEFRKANPRTSKMSTSYRSTNGTAHGAGNQAGQRLNLGRSISGNSTTKRLG